MNRANLKKGCDAEAAAVVKDLTAKERMAVAGELRRRARKLERDASIEVYKHNARRRKVCPAVADALDELNALKTDPYLYDMARYWTPAKRLEMAATFAVWAKQLRRSARAVTALTNPRGRAFQPALRVKRAEWN